MAISMLKIRRPNGIAIPGKTVFLIETAPRLLQSDIVIFLLVSTAEMNGFYPSFTVPRLALCNVLEGIQFSLMVIRCGLSGFWCWCLIVNRISAFWALYQYKDHFSRYGDSYHKDKTVMRLSYFYNGNPYTNKMGIFISRQSLGAVSST